MTFEIVFVLLSLLGMVAALVADKMRPGMILFSVVVLFLCAGILTPKEMLEGFSNKGMITVALLFLVSEGIRQSGTLGQVIKKLLPQGKTTVFKAQLRILPSVAFISAFLNNTPVVVIFAPIIKHWAKSVNLPATKFLIPLSYVTILGGICTLIGTSTNLVVHGMILEAGFEGFSMFELGKVGIFIAIAGIIYIFLFSKRLLPDARPDTAVPDEEVEEGEKLHRVEAVLGARFPGINKKLKDFNFQRHYGAEVKEIKTRNGQRFVTNLDDVVLHEGDTLVVMADDTFIPTWGESSVFVLLTNGNEPDTTGKKKRWFALLLLVLMIVGATVVRESDYSCTMGFYGPFAPAVQIYSCRGSVYWCGKAFLSLLLPESSKYWSATENNGPWEKELEKGKVYNKFQPATNLLITNYPNCGGSEMRSWCHETVAKDWQKFRSTENYNKLAYHTEFPWMADGKNGEISMNYGTKNKKGEWEVLRLYTFKSFENGIYRRDAVLETDSCVKYQLADIPLPDGILRVDKVSVSEPTEICLGHYSLPRLDTDIKETCRKVNKQRIPVLSNGEYELAMIPLAGWEKVHTVYPEGVHPVSEKCALNMVSDRLSGEKIYVTLQLWKKGDGKSRFTSKELNPVKSVNVSEDKKQVTVRLASGEIKNIAFE